MTRPSTILLIAGLALLLAACGGSAATVTPPTTATTVPPTATTPPTATSVPPTATAVPPTATAAPTATVAPTATIARIVEPTTTRPAATATVAAVLTRAATAGAVSSPTRPAGTAAVAPTRAATAGAAAGTSVTDVDGKCQMTVPPPFVIDASSRDSFQTADGKAFATIVSLDAAPLTFKEAVDIYTNTFNGAIENYQETDRQEDSRAARNLVLIAFSGSFVGQTIEGAHYFVQVNNGVVCGLTILVQPPAGDTYSDQLGTMIATLQAVKP